MGGESADAAACTGAHAVNFMKENIIVCIFILDKAIVQCYSSVKIILKIKYRLDQVSKDLIGNPVKELTVGSPVQFCCAGAVPPL